MANVFLQRNEPFLFRRFTQLPFLPNGLHEHGEIILVRCGRIQMRINDEMVSLGEGDMLLLSPFTYHQFEENRSGSLLFEALIFNTKLCPDLQNILSTRVPARSVIRKEAVSPLASSIFNHIAETLIAKKDCASDSTNGQEDRQFSLSEFGALNTYVSVLVHELTQVTGLREQDTQNLSTLKNVLVYCTEHYLDNISREDVADACAVNPNTVSEVFSRIGTSFREYINSHRISYAYSLLRNTNLSISEVMQRAGYLNQGTFNQNFVNRFHETPRDIRNKQTKEDL